MYMLIRHCLLVTILYLTALWSIGVQAAEDPSVRIAVAGPMSGTSVTVGAQYRSGVLAALDTLTDGRMLGRPIEVTTHDDHCLAEIAERVAREIVEPRPPDVVIGHSCSSATISSAPVYDDRNVLQITPASTNPQVTEMGIPTIFRMIGRDDLQGRIAARRIAEQHRGQRVGVMHAVNSYSRTLGNAAIDELRSLDIEPALVMVVPGNADSYLETIETLIDADIEVLYLVGGGLDSGIFLRQLRLMGSAMQVISTDTAVSAAFQESAGDAAEGVPFTFTPPAANLDSSAPAVRALQDMGMEPAGYALLAYAAVEVWLEGVRRAQSTEAGAVAEAIRTAPIDTILGSVRFDAGGDIITPYPPFVWYQWQGDERVLIE